MAWPGLRRDAIDDRSLAALHKKLDLLLGFLPVIAGVLLQMQKTESGMALDTSKLLAAVADEKTENASLRALVVTQNTAMALISAQLKDAIASGDPAALAAVQADIDKATADLSVDNQATKDALAANTQPADGSGSTGGTAAAGTAGAVG